MVWCGHPHGVVTASGCAPTPRAQHQASGPHVGSPLHRLNSSRSIKAPPPTRHIVPPVSHSLAVRGPLASTVTVHCLRQHDFIPAGPGQHKTELPLRPHHRESLIRYLLYISEMISIMYLDFEQVLPHDAPSQPVRLIWVVVVVMTQDQDDVLSRHQLAVSCCQINISLRCDLILDSSPRMSGSLSHHAPRSGIHRVTQVSWPTFTRASLPMLSVRR